MKHRASQRAAERAAATRAYIREAAASDTTGTSDELAEVAKVRDDSTITEDEFQAQKAKLLAA